LIDKTGHIKLTDFGSCTKVGTEGTVLLTNFCGETKTKTKNYTIIQIRSDVAVGTPEYISPEVLQAQEGGTHGMECDWWAMGIMMYEIIYGEVPFYSEQLTAMYGMIMGFKKSLKFPDEIEVSNEAKDFMKRFISLLALSFIIIIIPSFFLLFFSSFFLFFFLG
jgi:serine/threonine protein kinase